MAAAAPSGGLKNCVVWQCTACPKECMAVTPESWCMCNHRFKQHTGDGAKLSCTAPRCPCPSFFYIVAQGSWKLVCRCKHKAEFHDPRTKKCTKPKCPCTGFDSPWVCNCAHGWALHRQLTVQREIVTLQQKMEEAQRNLCDYVLRGEHEDEGKGSS